MAGLEQRFTLSDSGLEQQLDALIARGGDLKPAFDDIGQDMVLITDTAFEKQRSPEGVPWAPSAAARERGNPILYKTGNLRGSFSYVVLIGGEAGVVFGTNVDYAGYHQTGYAFRHALRDAKADPGQGFGSAVMASVISVPARPFIGASAKDIARWEGILRDYLAGPEPGASE